MRTTLALIILLLPEAHSSAAPRSVLGSLRTRRDPPLASIFGKDSALPSLDVPTPADVVTDEVPLEGLFAALPREASRALEIAELVVAAEAAWRSSCPVPLERGLCAKWEVKAAPPCHEERRLTVTARAHPEREKALRLARSALRLSEGASWRAPLSTRHIAQLTNGLGRARLLLADARLEASLVPIPLGLDFTPPSPNDPPTAQRMQRWKVYASVKQFTRWFNGRVATAAILDRYRALYAGGRGKAAAAAAMRVGTWFEQFSREVYSAPPPKPPRPPEGISEEEFNRAYEQAGCGEPPYAAEPLELKAIEAFAACRELARRLLDLDAIDECERALHMMKPGEFPLANEILPAPSQGSPVLLAPGLVREMP